MFQKTEDAYIVRTESTGDKVFLIQEGKKWWIKNPETLSALGFKFGDEKSVTAQELVAFEFIGPLDLKIETLAKIVEYIPEVSQVESKKKPILNYRKKA